MSDTVTDLNPLIKQLHEGSEKKQLSAIAELVAGEDAGWRILFDYLDHQTPLTRPLLGVGAAYQALRNSGVEAVTQELAQAYPTGIFPLESATGIDYTPLQSALAQQAFEAADDLTREKLCELAGSGAMQRQWLYFTEVEKIPSLDLHTINALWWLHSNGKFGFSVQRKLLAAVGNDFPKLWPKIGWKTGNIWTRWPSGFIWDVSAPAGHLPLLNQLRGVRVAESIYKHPVWQQYGW